MPSAHDAQWRDPAQVVSQWSEAGQAEPDLLRATARGRFWQTLAEHEITLLVTREYEHLVLALSPEDRTQTYMRLPHPSGLAVDLEHGVVHLASTRNPNQVFQLAPVTGLLERGDVSMNGDLGLARDRPLIPVRSMLLPGSFYIHDLALVGGRLHANAVGQNCVVRLNEDGTYKRAWWPRSIETARGPEFSSNRLQLNSIAAGPDLRRSFFSASADHMSKRRPSHRNFPVDRRGVIFAGSTREPVARGLTRPHSARFHGRTLWVDNSGYGELGTVEGGKFEAQLRLPGWTRGLCFHDGVGFVGTSRILPRFRHFAPGVDAGRAVCAVHAVDLERGVVLGSLEWPAGDQIFAIEAVPTSFTRGFPFRAGRRASERERVLFYAFQR